MTVREAALLLIHEARNVIIPLRVSAEKGIHEIGATELIRLAISACDRIEPRLDALVRALREEEEEEESGKHGYD